MDRARRDQHAENAVKMTSDITLGFRSRKKSCTEPAPPGTSTRAASGALASEALEKSAARLVAALLMIEQRLQAGPGFAGPACGRHLMTGRVLNWWNGGGEGSVHSSVVADAPHGLSAARRLAANASHTP